MKYKYKIVHDTYLNLYTIFRRPDTFLWFLLYEWEEHPYVMSETSLEAARTRLAVLNKRNSPSRYKVVE